MPYESESESMNTASRAVLDSGFNHGHFSKYNNADKNGCEGLRPTKASALIICG